MAPKKTTHNDHRADFLAAHGYGLAQLQATLARVDWQRADSLLRARRSLTLFLATCLEILAAAARAKRRSTGVFMGELAAAGNAAVQADTAVGHHQDERPLLWLVVRYAAHAGQAVTLPAARRALLDQAGTALRAHAQLLENGAPTPAQLPSLAGDQPTAVLALTHRLLREKMDADDPRIAQQLLRIIARSANNKPLTLLRTAQQLLKTDAHHGRIDYSRFRRLPMAMRRTILFTPALANCFLDAGARTAARPPSPDFDPIYIEQALDHLAAGVLKHIDVDALVVGSRSATVRTRMVQALANGSGQLGCDAAIRERLISAADVAELCLVACAAVTTVDDIRRALAQLKVLPDGGVLGEALHRFAMIARAVPTYSPAG